MKKTFLNTLLCAATFALVATSCAKNLDPANGRNGEVMECTLTAGLESAAGLTYDDTKVSLSESDNKTPLWEAGDKILILDATGNPIGSDGLFTLSATQPSGQGVGKSTAVFSGKIYIGQTPAHAVYPANCYDATAKTFSLPDKVDGTKATAFKNAVMIGNVTTTTDPATGNVTGRSISFRNACSVLRIDTGDYGSSADKAALKTIKIMAASSPITGKFSINWNELKLVPDATEASKELRVSSNEDAGYGANTSVFAPIFGTSSQEFTLKVYNIHGNLAVVSDDIEPQANFIKNLGTLGGMHFVDYDPEYWVDLGMVSKNGYPLYISRMDVDKLTLDETTGKYIVTWPDDETTPGKYATRGSAPAPIETEDGVLCRLINSDELLAFCLGDNFTFDFTSTTFAKGRNQNKVYFPSAHYAAGDRKYPLSIDKSLPRVCPGGADSYHVKLVYENTSADRVDLCEPILTYCENTLDYASFKYPKGAMYDYHIAKYDNESGEAVEHSCASGAMSQINYFLTVIECENQFKLVSFAELPEGLSYSITKKDGSPTANYSIDPGTNIMHFLGNNDGGSENKRVTVTLNGVSHWFNYKYMISCFVKGTLITLADGSKKPVEEITYDDELKVWNFDKGCYDAAKIFWLTKAGQTTEQYYRMTFSDGTVLNILGPQYKSGHKLYNYTDRRFEGVKTLEVGKEVYTENGVVTLVSKEEVNEEVEFYCLMTEDHLNCFAEGVLASLRYNNIYPFDENMKFIKDDRSRRPYKEFKAIGISREWYVGLRLGEQTDDLETIKKYVDRYDAQTREKPAPSLWQRFKTWWKSIFG